MLRFSWVVQVTNMEETELGVVIVVVTGASVADSTRSVVVQSEDPRAVQVRYCH